MSTVERVTLQTSRRVALNRLAEGSTDSTVVFCHAAPGAGSFDPDPEVTLARGVTLIATDRPGYGGSDPVREGDWASVDRAAEDIAEVLGQLGVRRAGVAGWSAGGRVALALAARHPELVERVAVIATPAPHEEVPWIPPELQAGIDAMRGLPPEQVHAAFEEQMSALVPADPRSPEALGQLGAGDADTEALAYPGARERLADMMGAAFARGAAGMAADIAGYTLAPWGFEPSEVKAKALLVYGSADEIAGQRHGSWWQKHLPDARLEMVPGAGHMLVIPSWGRVLAHLAPGRKR